MSPPSNRIRLFAWLVIVMLGIGAAANAYSFAIGDPAYTSGLWLTFLVLKLAGVVAGVLLLNRRRSGAWLLVASFAVGLVIVGSRTGPYPLWQWIGAAAVAALLFAAGWMAIAKNWRAMKPMRPGSGD